MHGPSFHSVPHIACTLLVLTADDALWEGFKQAFSPLFDDILFATDPFVANQIIETERVTHLLVHHDLATPVDGVVFLTFWKREFQTIERAVLLVGSKMPKAPFPVEIDALVSTSDGVHTIARALIG